MTKKAKGEKPPASGKKSRQRPESGSGDIAMVVARDADGVHILRRRSEEAPIEAGLLRPMREGQPISGEVITLKQREDVPIFYDVRTEFGGPEEAEAKAAGDGRPAQVASNAYRKGWEAVWGGGGRRRDRSIN